MIVFPPCKVNLGLDVLARRPDGYHEIKTLMYPVGGLCDVLEIVPSDHEGATLTLTGRPVEGDLADNLCCKAYRLLAADHPMPGVEIYLHKIIPSGAGLGGGSSDAAYTLKVLNDMFELGLDRESLCRYAARLGSDVPFFIDAVPAVASGRGEILKPYEIDLSGHQIVILKPAFSISTAQAYAGVTPVSLATSLEERLAHGRGSWKEGLSNAFEKFIFPRSQVLPQIKEWLYGSGALYASMSGSGSAMYGIFPPGGLNESKLRSEAEQFFTDIWLNTSTLG